jgi:hypothetical protein
MTTPSSTVGSQTSAASSASARIAPPARIGWAAYGLFALIVLPFWGHEAARHSVDSGYDWANRAYALPLVCLVAALVLLRRNVRSRWFSACVAGAAGMAAGVVLEFYLGALQNAPLSDDAHRRGLPGSSVWWGSNAGFAIYGIGMLVLTVSTIGLAISLRRTLGPVVAPALGLVGPLALAGFVAKDGGGVPAAVVGVLTCAAAFVVATGSVRTGGGRQHGAQ